MLFYAALTVAGIITAALLVWLLRSLTVAGRSAYRTLSPSAAKGQARVARVNSNLAAAPAPWGWSGGKPAVAGGPGAQRHDAATERPIRTKDFSSLEAYGRSNEKMKLERDHTSPHVGSVRNVLTGYDMRRTDGPDTSSWPYRDSLGGTSSAVPTESRREGNDERPTKPWGW